MIAETKTRIPTTLKNGATYLMSITDFTKGKSIPASSKGQTTKTPVAPKVKAAYSYHHIFPKNVLYTIQDITVYIDADLEIKSLFIYKLNELLHGVDIYVAYQAPEKIPTNLIPYTFNVSFTELSQPFYPFVNTIESYLYNIDPVSSSGTKTTVKKGM